eukprot:7160453-Pyramimonas_sp.AAC.1
MAIDALFGTGVRSDKHRDARFRGSMERQGARFVARVRTCSPDTVEVSRRESGATSAWPTIGLVSTHDAPQSRFMYDHLDEPSSWTCRFSAAATAWLQRRAV